MHKCEIKKEKRENLARKIILVLFVPLVYIGGLFYIRSGKSVATFCSGIIALSLYFAMYINRYHLMNSFPEGSLQREKHFKIHQILRICLFGAGIVLMLALISAFENMEKLQ